MKLRFNNVWLILFISSVLIIACDSGYNPPSDHTVSKDGNMHKPGLNSPLDNCIDCHGTDLRGGTSGVSCYECHGNKW